MREEVLLSPARRALSAASSADRSRFEEIVRALCADPSLDPPLKEPIDVPPVVVYRYHDGAHWVVYDLPDEATVRIWMMGSVPDEPRPY